MPVFQAGNHVEVALTHDPELRAFDRSVSETRPPARELERVYISVKRAAKPLVGWGRPRGTGPVEEWLGSESAFLVFLGRWRDMLEGKPRYVPGVHDDAS